MHAERNIPVPWREEEFSRKKQLATMFIYYGKYERTSHYQKTRHEAFSWLSRKMVLRAKKDILARFNIRGFRRQATAINGSPFCQSRNETIFLRCLLGKTIKLIYRSPQKTLDSKHDRITIEFKFALS